MRKLAALVALVIACAGGSGAKSPNGAAPPPIVWQSFGPGAFATAQRENKLVMVDVGIEGCTACNYMLKHTYRDAEVIRHIKTTFIPITINTNTQPDLDKHWET